MKSPAAAYGPIASRFAETLLCDEPLIAFDHTGAADALRDCAQRRFENRRFLVRALLQREHSLRSDAVLPAILSTMAGTDERREALEHAFAGVLTVNGQPLSAHAAYDPASLRLMQAAVRLSDGLLVSSQAERRRICELLGVDPEVVVAPAGNDAPRLSPAAERSGVVIWAPRLAGSAAFAFVLALAELQEPLWLVSADAPAGEALARWLPQDEADRVLRSAKLIVDTNAFGCDDAPALVCYGASLIADAESGVQEMFDGVRVYDRRRFGSIFEAAISAIGMPAPRPHPILPVTQTLGRRALLRNGPRVSVMIPTLDRTAMLRDALKSVERQTYGNLETIVVIDGGPRLDALAPEFPNVTFMHMPENNPVASSNAAFAATSGEYVTLLSDDDLFFPDHIAELVTALERSRASVAHGDVLTAFLRSGDGDWLLYGLESNMSRYAEKSALLVSNQVGAVGVMFRRSAISGDPPFDDSIPFCRDYALWLRLAAATDFIHVERVTSCYTIRNRGAQQQSVMWSDGTLDGYRALYARYPVDDRPVLRRRREGILQSIGRGAMGLAGEPAAQVAPVPWPLWRT